MLIIVKKTVTVAFLGCGFLASHILPAILPFCQRIILVDRERLAPENYENGLFLKGSTNRRKVSVLSSMVQLLASTTTVPIHKSISTERDLKEIESLGVDVAFVTFDNIPSRLLVKDHLTVPAISVGVTENYALIDWMNHVVLPRTAEEIERVEKELELVRDACTRIEFRPLGALAAAHAAHVFYVWLQEGRKLAIELLIRNGKISVTTFERSG